MNQPVKTIVWIGSSRKDLRSFPAPVRKSFGQALYTAQQGETDPAAKPLKGFPGTQVMEIVERYKSDAYRAVYTVQFGDILYVLHAFQKKSKQGIAAPLKDIERIHKRLLEAKRDYKQRKNQDDG
jgi:phage-related protein